MTTVQPPPFAARLLRRLVPAQNHEALLGDLCEEYQRRRSRAWYWLQIIAAIVVGTWKDIRANRLLTLRAIGIGVASLVLYFFALGSMLNTVSRYLREGILVGNHWIYWRPQPTTFILQVAVLTWVWVLAGFVVSGWVIGRLHRDHGITFVIAFAALVQLLYLVASVVAFILIPSSRVPVDHSRDTTLSPLWLSLCVVIGGYFATRRAKAA
jgi:hypothetical protein